MSQTEKKREGVEKYKKIFTERQIQDFACFYEVMKTVHTRLITEGYKIENGVLIPPEKSDDLPPDVPDKKQG